MKYDVILFDADETLYDFKRCEREALKNAMIDQGFDYNEEHDLPVYKTENGKLWRELEEGKITLKALKIERFKRFGQALGQVIEAESFAERFTRHLSNGSFLFEHSETIIARLFEGHRLAVVTNGLKKVQDKRIKQSILAQYFDEIIISEEVQLSKPNPKIFEHTMDRLDYRDKKRILMVGDSLTSDIQGGINYGIDTCWYNPKGLSNPTDIQPTYEIRSLLELEELVK